MENMLIAAPHIKLKELCYQITIRKENKECYLNTVNIISGRKILMKIKEDDTKLDFKIENAEDIAMEFICRRIKLYKPKKKTQSTKKAKQKAAENLMKQFKL
jgi:hypothetical protein